MGPESESRGGPSVACRRARACGSAGPLGGLSKNDSLILREVTVVFYDLGGDISDDISVVPARSLLPWRAACTAARDEPRKPSMLVSPTRSPNAYAVQTSQRRRDLHFRIVHGGKDRVEVFQEMASSARCGEAPCHSHSRVKAIHSLGMRMQWDATQSWENGHTPASLLLVMHPLIVPSDSAFRVVTAIVLTLAVASLGLGVAELSLDFGFSSEPALIVAASGLVLASAVLGLIGVANLGPALTADKDGVETWPQRLIEAHVWIGMPATFLLCVVGVSYLASPVDDGTRLTSLATRSPGAFEGVAQSLGACHSDALLGSSASDEYRGGCAAGVLELASSRMHGLRIGASIVSLCMAALMLGSLGLAARLVTLYELAQSFMQHLSLLLFLSAVALLLLGAVGFIYIAPLQNAPIDWGARCVEEGLCGTLRLATYIASSCLLVLGTCTLPVAALGLLGYVANSIEVSSRC